MPRTKWEKAYHGPFQKDEALKLVEGLREVANPDKNLIYDARLRVRTTRRSDMEKRYDVFIKVTNEN